MENSNDHYGKVRNVIRNTYKQVKYIIWADRKLTREEMIKQLKFYNFNSINLKTRPGDVIEIDYDENL